MTALILTTYNRPSYLRRCLDSLRNAVLPDMVIIIDDASTDKETVQLINDFPADYKIFKRKNKGIKDSLLIGYQTAFDIGATHVINLDADAIVKPDFVAKLGDLYDAQHIISGFNCNNPKNPILSEHEGYVMRQHGNGINMLVDRNQYETVIKPALLSNGNWDFNSTNKYPFKIARPSCIQHIGLQSSMGHVGADVACDFKLLSLPDVTLFGIDAHDPKGLMRAAEICQREVDFGALEIITERLFTGREAYSKFCITDMHKYVDTSHVLIIHPDGYILNPGAWRDEWLQYDYIGALWEWYGEHKNGNGGFCLRSKKLLDILATLDLSIYHPEDDIICRHIRPWLEREYGIKFAPDDVCRAFSIEGWGMGSPVWNGEFGFHGKRVSLAKVPAELRLPAYMYPKVRRNVINGGYRRRGY